MSLFFIFNDFQRPCLPPRSRRDRANEAIIFPVYGFPGPLRGCPKTFWKKVFMVNWTILTHDRRPLWGTGARLIGHPRFFVLLASLIFLWTNIEIFIDNFPVNIYSFFKKNIDKISLYRKRYYIANIDIIFKKGSRLWEKEKK